MQNCHLIDSLQMRKENKYIFSASDLATVLGMYDMSHLVSSLESIKGKTGIIFWENYHIDIWDGEKMIGNGSDDYKKTYILSGDTRMIDFLQILKVTSTSLAHVIWQRYLA